MTKQRLDKVDIMQGIAMFLVVLGHHSTAFAPNWYTSLHACIYSFHMGLFVFISGLLIRYTHRPGSWKEERASIKLKFKKFAVPYLLIGSFATVISLHGPNQTGAFLTQMMNLLFFPLQSSALFLWYIYLLFILYLISPFFFRLSYKLQVVFLLLSIGLTFYLPTHFLAINQLFRYFFFYCAGVLCAQHIESLRKVSNLWLALSGVLLIGALILKINWDFQIPYVITGALSLPACYGIAKLVRKASIIKTIADSISHNCFTIYLLQMFVINAGVLVWSKLHLQTQVPFAVYLMLSTSLAIIVPIYLSKFYKKLKSKLI